MILNMIHGRKTVDEDMDDWGFDGPTLTGIKAVHYTYNTHPVFHFKGKKSFKAAQKATGWEVFDDLALQGTIFKNLLEIKKEDGQKEYFGDWEIQPARKKTEKQERKKEADLRYAELIGAINRFFLAVKDSVQ